MGDDERELEELLRIKKQRLAALNQQVARLGYEAPAHLVVERNDLRAEIEADKKALEPIIKGEISEEALAAIRSYGLPASISNALLMLDQGLKDLKDEFREFRDQIRRESQTDHTERITRQSETDKRFDRVDRRVGRLTRLQWIVLTGVIVSVSYAVASGVVSMVYVIVLIASVILAAAVAFWYLKD